MASNVDISETLTNYQVVRLSQVISCNQMEAIALGYLNIDEEKIKNLKAARRDDTEGFVRDVIKEWACRNPDDQVQVRVVITARKRSLGQGNVFTPTCLSTRGGWLPSMHHRTHDQGACLHGKYASRGFGRTLRN